jgi:hypothetical protein
MTLSLPEPGWVVFPAGTARANSQAWGAKVIRKNNVIKLFDGEIELPIADNTAEALHVYRAANERFRQIPWPAPFDKTTHLLELGDARDLSSVVILRTAIP